MGLRLAKEISKTCGCKVNVVLIKTQGLIETPEDKEMEKEKLEELNNWVIKIIGEQFSNIYPTICNYHSITGGILSEARKEKCDLIIIGASEEWRLKKFLFGSIPDYVANKALCSVLMVKKHEAPYISWLRKIINLVSGK